MNTRSAAVLLLLVLASAAACITGCSRGGGHPLVVHLRDGVSGKPIAGAPLVWCFTEPDPDTGSPRRFNEVSDTTDAEGACVFTNVPPERANSLQAFLVEAKPEGFCVAAHIDSFTFRPGSSLELDLGALPLWTEGRISGRVLDAARGTPIAGASVAVTATRLPESPAETSGDPRYRETSEYQAVSGPDGAFTVDVDHYALDRASYWLTVDVKHEGYTYAVQDLGATREEKGSRVDVNYAHINCMTWLSADADSAPVTGRLLDAAGHPVAGAELMLASVKYFNTCPRGCHGGEPHPMVAQTVVTGKDGRFTATVTDPFLYGLPDGIRVARGGDFQYWRTPLALGQRQANHRFEFADSSRVELSVDAPGG